MVYEPCWCPPRSYVVNLTLPIASSSEAAALYSINEGIGLKMRTGVKGRLESGQSVVLQHMEKRL